MHEFTRPTRVVIVDADNPLQEIRGEFFWREDHERIVASEVQASYLDGYREGFEAAAGIPAATLVVRPRLGRRVRRMAVRVLVLVVFAAFVIDVLVPAILDTV